MTKNFSITDAAAQNAPTDFLNEAESLYRDAAGELFGALKKLKRGQIDEAKAAAQAVKDLRQALDWVMDERNRVEKLRKSVAGAVGATELDLDAARDEIGRRFTCLRSAAGH